MLVLACIHDSSTVGSSDALVVLDDIQMLLLVVDFRVSGLSDLPGAVQTVNEFFFQSCDFAAKLEV